MKAGADPEKEDKNGKSSMHIASYNKTLHALMHFYAYRITKIKLSKISAQFTEMKNLNEDLNAKLEVPQITTIP